ncbi:O-succinylbenzoate synthase, partial [Mycolicibacterium insubricum]|nr:O-succinylbenzoate synthase [Mycolicibacterium insubricum]
MRALIDVSGARAFAVPGRVPGTAGVEGMLIEGPQGWGEFSPRCEAEASRAFVAGRRGGHGGL